MSKINDDFFVEKKEWSKTKDKILGRYLVPYFQKVFALRKPVCYVDCFAGKGKFDDGNDGSPIIALKSLDSTFARSKHNPIVSTYFIELNHGDSLENNVEDYKHKPYQVDVIKGRFEDNIDSILDKHDSDTIFLYIDPYGIKALDVNKFNSFKKYESKSVELLINFNTWGFVREACRIYGATIDLDEDVFDYLKEYDPSKITDAIELTNIVGGKFWISIIKDYKNGKINFNEAEELITKKIAENFRKKYKYVLNLPVISSEDATIPKYRLFHLTNHAEGCYLMANNMHDAFVTAEENNRHGQMSLFEDSSDRKIYSDEELKKMLFNELPDRVNITPFICEFYTKYGMLANTSKLEKLIAELEKEGLVKLNRLPSSSNGKKLSFMKEIKDHKLIIEKLGKVVRAE